VSVRGGPFSQGGNGAAGGGFDNNTALAVAEGRLHDVRFSQGGLPLYGPSDLAAGDVLLTGEGGLAQYLKTTGDYGHGGVVTDADGFMSVSVGSSDNRGIYVAPNSDAAVGGRTWDIFRVPGARVQGVNAFFGEYAKGGGLREYFGNAGGNVCSSCAARSIELGGGPLAPRAIGNLVTPNALGRFYGPPVGRIMMPRF